MQKKRDRGFSTKARTSVPRKKEEGRGRGTRGEQITRFCEQMNIIKGQRFYNTTYNEYNTIVLYSVLYTYNRTIEASLMPFQTYCYQSTLAPHVARRRRRWRRRVLIAVSARDVRLCLQLTNTRQLINDKRNGNCSFQ